MGGLLLFCFAKLYIGHLSFWPISKHNGFKKFIRELLIGCLFVSSGAWALRQIKEGSIILCSKNQSRLHKEFEPMALTSGEG